MTGEGGWTCVKEFLGWILDTEAGTVTLPERKFEELLALVDIPATQHRMGRKDLERLVGKLCSMHLAVPVAVAHLFHIQCALNQGGVDRAWLSTASIASLHIGRLLPSRRSPGQRTWQKSSVGNQPI